MIQSSDAALDSVVSATRRVRVAAGRREEHVVAEIERELRAAGIVYRREVRIGPRCRVDLLAEGGVAIEVKRGKPNTRRVAEQITRYAECDVVNAVVLVSERGLVAHLDEAAGKPVRYVALSTNWGLTT
ncbi:MAG: PD-(D/E)XK nuclease family protein [bacterium]|nr:PD-(D/E)XK nuclease family protein [bacterium]